MPKETEIAQSQSASGFQARNVQKVVEAIYSVISNCC